MVPPRRRCATALASKKLLASLRLAGGYRVVICTAPSRGKAASRLYLSRYRRTASTDFYSVRASSRSARRLRRQHKAAHGSSGYAGAPLAVLHFVARRRLPAVKRTATMPGRVCLQGQDRATYCIAHPFGGYAAKT